MKKYKIYILGLISLLFTFNSYAQYTVADDDVLIFNNYIIGLTDKGKENIKDTSILIPTTLQNKKVIGIASIVGQDGVFQSRGLKSVNLPATIEDIGACAFFNNRKMDYPNFKELTELKYIGRDAFSSFVENNSETLDFSNLEKLEYIQPFAFFQVIDNVKKIDFSNCVNLKSIGLAALTQSKTNQFTEINFSNCKNLSYIDGANFVPMMAITDSAQELTADINFSNCNSLILISPISFGYGHKQMSSLLSKLPTPQIPNLTFISWERYYFESPDEKTYGLLATFEELVISVKILTNNHGWGKSKNSPQTYQEMLTYIPQQKNAKDSKLVKFEIRNHSINNIEISNILCTTQGCTLDWTNGTIETGKTQTVTVTYPEGTEDYTATITIEGENLMGNTTVNVGKTGGVTTDDNLLSGVAQQNIQDGNLFKLSPNPTNNFINIQLSDFNTQSPTDIEIYNMQGKLMYKNKITERETKIDITDFTPDNYLVIIKKDDKYEVKQVIKH